MESLTNCLNCNVKLKSLLSTIKIYGKGDISFIQAFTDFSGENLCQKCGKEYLDAARKKFKKEQKEINTCVKKYYRSFPILTIQSPVNWNYEALGIVTAQATMDNRVRNTSIIDTILGANQNLVDLDSSANKGERTCLELLRQKTYSIGGNAVVGVDIDYAEFGLKGELMLICMAGTAINVREYENINERIIKAQNEFKQQSDRVERVAKYHVYGN